MEDDTILILGAAAVGLYLFRDKIFGAIGSTAASGIIAPLQGIYNESAKQDYIPIIDEIAAGWVNFSNAMTKSAGSYAYVTPQSGGATYKPSNSFWDKLSFWN